MKKLLLVPTLLIATIGFSQTFKSSQVLSSDGVVGKKKENHTTIIKDSSVVFDGVSYKVSKINETIGATRSVTYADYKGVMFTFFYTKNKIARIIFINTVDGVTNNIICCKAKEIK